jgi:hypothetical protein
MIDPITALGRDLKLGGNPLCERKKMSKIVMEFGNFPEDRIEEAEEFIRGLDRDHTIVRIDENWIEVTTEDDLERYESLEDYSSYHYTAKILEKFGKVNVRAALYDGNPSDEFFGSYGENRTGAVRVIKPYFVGFPVFPEGKRVCFTTYPKGIRFAKIVGPYTDRELALTIVKTGIVPR